MLSWERAGWSDLPALTASDALRGNLAPALPRGAERAAQGSAGTQLHLPLFLLPDLPRHSAEPPNESHGSLPPSQNFPGVLSFLIKIEERMMNSKDKET